MTWSIKSKCFIQHYYAKMFLLHRLRELWSNEDYHPLHLTLTRNWRFEKLNICFCFHDDKVVEMWYDKNDFESADVVRNSKTSQTCKRRLRRFWTTRQEQIYDFCFWSVLWLNARRLVSFWFNILAAGIYSIKVFVSDLRLFGLNFRNMPVLRRGLRSKFGHKWHICNLQNCKVFWNRL